MLTTFSLTYLAVVNYFISVTNRTCAGFEDFTYQRRYGATTLNGKCYKMMSKNPHNEVDAKCDHPCDRGFTYSEAKQKCSENGASLADLSDAIVNQVVSNYIRQSVTKVSALAGNYWISGEIAKDKPVRWSPGAGELIVNTQRIS